MTTRTRSVASGVESNVGLPRIGYHGTTWANVPSILKDGLRLSNHPIQGTIWVARTPEEAALSGGPAVFEVDFEGIKGGWFDDFETGEDAIWQGHLFEPIPPDRLRLITSECSSAGSL